MEVTIEYVNNYSWKQSVRLHSIARALNEKEGRTRYVVVMSSAHNTLRLLADGFSTPIEVQAAKAAAQGVNWREHVPPHVKEPS